MIPVPRARRDSPQPPARPARPAVRLRLSGDILAPGEARSAIFEVMDGASSRYVVVATGDVFLAHRLVAVNETHARLLRVRDGRRVLAWRDQFTQLVP